MTVAPMPPAPDLGHRPLASAGLVLAAMALIGIVDNFVATIAETTGLWQFQVIRSAMALTLLTLAASTFGWRLRPRRWRRVAARCMVQSAALMLYFASLALMPVEEAVAGLFTAPIFVALISALIYRHPIGPMRAFASVAGFAGVLMVLRPETGGMGWPTLLPVLAGLFYAMSALATREWCAGEAAVTLLWGYFAIMGVWGILGVGALTLYPLPVPEGAPGFALRAWGTMAPEAWGWTAGQAVCSLISVGLLTRAYQIAEASYVAVFEYALLITVVAWAWVLFGDDMDLWASAGIAVIVISGGIIALRGRATG